MASRCPLCEADHMVEVLTQRVDVILLLLQTDLMFFGETLGVNEMVPIF